MRFASEDPARIAGDAAALSPAHGHAQGSVDGISVVASTPTRETRRMIAAFREGVRRARPEQSVRVDYVATTRNPGACEQAANDQIDDGSDVVVAIAGTCGLGAAAVARSRGVWVVGEDEYGMTEQPWVLASLFKDFTRGPQEALDAFLDGTLPQGQDLVLRLGDDYVVGTSMGPGVPAQIQSDAIAYCSDIRRHPDLSPG